MAMIAIPIDSSFSSLLQRVDVPGNRDFSDHCTLIYFENEMPIKKIVKMIPLIHELTGKMIPFNIKSTTITSFDKGKHGYPIIARLESKELFDLEKEIKKIFDKNKIKYSTKYKEFKPHITLSYSDVDLEKDLKFDKALLQVNSIGLYGDDNNIYVNFPFSLGIKKKAAYLDKLTEYFKNNV